MTDLDAYLARIGCEGPLAPTAETLHALHLAHATSIPFENLDVLAGRPIRLDPEALRAKLVDGRRGGYCFEQNLLLADALEAIGFRVDRLLARVRWNAARVLPRTHMALRVEADGADWLADVGFGGWGLLHPIPLEPGRVDRQFGWPFRLDREGHAWRLRAEQAGEWRDLYDVTTEPQLPVDFEPANFYVSNHPDSPFLRGLIAQRPTPGARFILRGRELAVARPDGQESRTLSDDAEVARALADHFGLADPAATEAALGARPGRADGDAAPRPEAAPRVTSG